MKVAVVNRLRVDRLSIMGQTAQHELPRGAPTDTQPGSTTVVRKLLAGLFLGLILLTAVLIGVSIGTSRGLERTVTTMFNEEQLILTQNISREITNQIAYLKSSLLALTPLIESEAGDPATVSAAFTRVVLPFRAWDVLAVGHAAAAGGLLYDLAKGRVPPDLDFLPPELRKQAADPAQAGHVFASRDFVPATGPFAGRRVMILGTPTTAAPGAMDFFVLDPLSLAQRHARPVRSGETGYAWVINGEGIFLSHFEEGFIGKSSLTVRQERDPSISYARINELVTEKLLTGQTGMDWYVSGWHRGTLGEMRKLLAYCPVHYAGPEEPQLWSVGLAAPTGEISGIIQPLLLRQWLVEGIAICIAFGGLVTFIFLSLRWARTLGREVERTTSDLKASEADLRRERDRVTASMRELLDTQERLVRSERFAAIGQAAAHLAHEIKNPLMLMGGFAAQVRGKLPEDSPFTEKLRIIEEEAKRLEHMLVEVQNFTRPIKPQKTPADLNAVVRETVSLMTDMLAAHGIDCRVEADAGLPVFDFDPNQIKQVILNLAKNAAEAMEAGGRLSIRTWREDGLAKVSVKDTGPGMSGKVLASIFNPFFTTKARGTGLGLALSFRIMEDHGGDITVTSEEGKGSTFVLSLPLETLREAGSRP